MNNHKRVILEASGLFGDYSKKVKLESKTIIDAVNSIDIKRLKILLSNDLNNGDLTLKILGNENAVNAVNSFHIEKLERLLMNIRVRENILKGLLDNHYITDAINLIDTEKLDIVIDNDIFIYGYHYSNTRDVAQNITIDVETSIIGNRQCVEAINSISFEKLRLLFVNSWGKQIVLCRILEDQEIVDGINLMDFAKLKILLTVFIDKDRTVKLIKLIRNRDIVHAINSLSIDVLNLILPDDIIRQCIEEFLLDGDTVKNINSVNIDRLRMLYTFFTGDGLSRILRINKAIHVINSLHDEKFTNLFDRGIVCEMLLEGILHSNYAIDILNSINDKQLRYLSRNNRSAPDTSDVNKRIRYRLIAKTINSMNIKKVKIVIKNLIVVQSRVVVSILECKNAVNVINSMNNIKLDHFLKSYPISNAITGEIFGNLFVEGINAMDMRKFSLLLLARNLQQQDDGILLKILCDEYVVRALNSLDFERFKMMIYSNVTTYQVLVGLVETENSFKTFKRIKSKKLDVLLMSGFIETLENERNDFCCTYSDIELGDNKREPDNTNLLGNYKIVNSINSIKTKKLNTIINLTKHTNRIRVLLEVVKNESNVKAINSINNRRLNVLLGACCIRIIVKRGLFRNNIIEGIKALNFDNFKLLFDYIGKIDYPHDFRFDRARDKCHLVSLLRYPNVVDGINGMSDGRFKLLTEKISNTHALIKLLENSNIIEAIKGIDIEKLKYVLRIERPFRLIERKVFENEISIDFINTINAKKLKIITKNIKDPDNITSIFLSRDVYLRRNLIFSIVLRKGKFIENFDVAYVLNTEVIRGDVEKALDEDVSKNVIDFQSKVKNNECRVLNLKYLCVEALIEKTIERNKKRKSPYCTSNLSKGGI